MNTAKLSRADWLLAFHERAAILEFDANLSRREAEDRAWRMTIEAWGEAPEGVELESLRKPEENRTCTTR